ncbi:hypothetical protein NDU88_005613 [Pleurodeles waltl]|uniref:Uncharacterized protein n=1 Tax=Pleurodeles waltl TaxID=8319 RepID=A0AAV7QG70_PLEWA|nr:hypothetical protein NDU88_005613 [Pleurodeles waltl]
MRRDCRGWPGSAPGLLPEIYTHNSSHGAMMSRKMLASQGKTRKKDQNQEGRPRERETGTESDDYGRGSERAAIPKTIQKSGFKRDSREEAPVPDCCKRETNLRNLREEEMSRDSSHAPGGPWLLQERICN